MPKILITDREGNNHEIDVDKDYTLMEALRDNGFDIEASCGGCCACATCHVYISEEWVNRLNKKEDEEESMLDQTFNILNNSRLSCQIEYSDKINGIKLKLAPE